MSSLREQEKRVRRARRGKEKKLDEGKYEWNAETEKKNKKIKINK